MNLKARRAVQPVLATTFNEAVDYLITDGAPGVGSRYQGVFTLTPIHPDDWLQYVRDLAEKAVPTGGRHRDHYMVCVDQVVIGNIVVTRNPDMTIVPGVVAVPL